MPYSSRSCWIFTYLARYAIVLQNLSKCYAHGFAGMRCRKFETIQKYGDGFAIDLEEDKQSHKRTVVGGAPGICSKAETSVIFLVA